VELWSATLDRIDSSEEPAMFRIAQKYYMQAVEEERETVREEQSIYDYTKSLEERTQGAEEARASIGTRTSDPNQTGMFEVPAKIEGRGEAASMAEEEGRRPADVAAYRVEFEEWEGREELRSVEGVSVADATKRPERVQEATQPQLDMASVGAVDPTPTRVYEVPAEFRERDLASQRPEGFREKLGELLGRLQSAMARENSRDTDELER